MNSLSKENNPNPLDLIIGDSSSILKLKDTIKKVSPHDIPVLIKGETGTGKELVANAIHLLSNRSKGPYVVTNCGGISPQLALSDFFGHSKGAFTGADKNRKGYFYAADKGSLFLDELGELAQSIQASLLRVLEGKEITKLGTEESIKIDTRIIAATNKDLEELIKKGKFREDLFHRLNACTINIPSLRERPEDIGLLTKYFLKKACEFHKNDEKNPRIKNISISPQAIKDLEAYPWPGNIRKLMNVVNFLTIMICDNSEITTKDIKKFKPEIYKKTKGQTVYIKNSIDTTTQNTSEEINGDFVITNLKRISDFIKVLNGDKERKKRFTGLIIRYYLLKFDRNKETTAKNFGLSPIVFGQILERYKPFIENIELDSFFEIIPIFGMNLKKARKKLSKLNKLLIEEKEEKDKNFSNLSKQTYGYANNSFLLNLDDTTYFNNSQTGSSKEEDKQINDRELKLNGEMQNFIEELKKQKEPMKAFIGLFIRFHLINNGSIITETAKTLGTSSNNLYTYKSYYNSDYLDKYLNLIKFFGTNYYQAKVQVIELSKGSISIRNKYKKRKKEQKPNHIKVGDITIPKEIYDILGEENIEKIEENKLKLIVEKLSIEDINRIGVESLISMSIGSIKSII